MYGYLRYDALLYTIIAGKAEGRRGRERPRRTFLEQIKNIGVVSYKEVKQLAPNREE